MKPSVPLSPPQGGDTGPGAAPAPRPGAVHRPHRAHLWLALLGVLALGYLLAGFIGVPWLVRTQAQSFVKTQYGRPLAIRRVQFNPFTLRLEIQGAQLPDADGAPMLGFERLVVQPALASLWHFAVSFREILLEQPRVHVVVRPDGNLNLLDLAKTASPAPAAKQPGSAPMRLFIERLRVVAGAGELEDRTIPGPFREILRPINFDLRNFSTRAGTDNLSELTAASASGARLKWNGSFQLQPVASRGSFELTGLPVRTLWTYLRKPLPAATPPGTVALNGRYDAALKGSALGLTVNLPEISLVRFALRPEGVTGSYIELPQVKVSNTRVDLQKHTVDIGRVVSSDGSIHAWRTPGGAINLTELLPPPAPQPAPAPGATPGAPAAAAPAWHVSVPDIQVRHLLVEAEDRQVTPAAHLRVDPLDLTVAGYSTAPGSRLDITLDSQVNGGRLQATAQVTPGADAAHATVDLTGLDLKGLQPYLSAQTGMTLLSGRLGSRLGVERGAAGALSVKGEVRVSDLRTVDDEARQDFIRWKDLRVADIRYESKPASLRIGTITARAPYARVIVFPSLTTNISEILTPRARLKGRARLMNPADLEPSAAAGAPAAGEAGKDSSQPPQAAKAETQEPAGKGGAAPPGAPAEKPEVAQQPAPGDTGRKGRKGRKGRGHAAVAQVTPPPPLTPFPTVIRTIQVVDGSANYADYWIQPNFAVGIQTLNGTVKGLSSDPKSRARVKLEGKVDRYAPVHIDGELNLLSATQYSDIHLSFKGVDMTTVTPYSGRFAGYKIDKGKLSVDLGYKVENRQLTAEQHFVIDQLQLGDKVDSKDAVKLPLKLAIALLKDRNGVIDIGLPMTGSLDDPHFRIGPLIWKAFLGLMTKIVTAPFAALGHLFGGGNEHMNVIEFAPGSAQLDEAGKGNVQSVIKALNERPQLKLDVPAAYSPGIDRPGLAALRLRQQMVQAAHGRRRGQGAGAADESVLANPAEHFRLAMSAYRSHMQGQDLPQSALTANQTRAKDAASLDAAIHDLETPIIEHMQIPDADLEKLGEQRAQAIEDALVAGGVDPTRVFVVKESRPEAPAADKAGADKVRVEMALK